LKHGIFIVRSTLTEEAKGRIPAAWHHMYERVWDEADYVVPPAENGAFFVTTNVIITPNQTRSNCPESHGPKFRKAICQPEEKKPGQTNECPRAKVVANHSMCEPGSWASLVHGHGTYTGCCVRSDLPHPPSTNVCEVQAWCPLEMDQTPLLYEDGPLIPGNVRRIRLERGTGGKRANSGRLPTSMGAGKAITLDRSFTSQVVLPTTPR